MISIDFLNVHTYMHFNDYLSEVQIQQEKRYTLNIVNVGSKELFEVAEEKIYTLLK